MTAAPDRRMPAAPTPAADVPAAPRRRWFVAALAAYALIAALGVRERTVTTDEPFHLMYSRQAIVDGTFVRWIPGNEVAHNSKMPASLPNAGVSVLLDRFAPDIGASSRLFLERLPTIAWGILGAIYTFLFARRLFGVFPAWLCLGFYFTEPNLLAHGALITTDVPDTAATIAVLYHLHAWLLRPDAKHALLLGAVLGLAQVAKYSCVILLPVVAIAAVGTRFLQRRALRKGAPLPTPRLKLSAILGHGFLALLAMILVINVAFRFEGTGTPYPEKPPDPAKFERFGTKGKVLKLAFDVIRPALGVFPTPYLQGLSMVMQNDREGPGPHVYVLGRLSDKGVPWYFAVITAFKWTLPILVLLAASLGALAWRRFRGASLLVLLLFVPATLIFLHVSFGLNHQFGVRYILPIIPLAILGGAGRLACAFPGRPARALLLALLAWQAVATALWFPHWMSFTNELVPDKKQAYRYFADCNLQWGQDDGELADYVAAHPEERLVVDPAVAAPGRLVVGVNELVGQSNRIDYFMLDRYAWLRENFQPVGRITHSFLVYEVPEERVLDLYERARGRMPAAEFPRPMKQWYPPWITEGEPVPELELRGRAAANGGPIVVEAVVRSETKRSRPWNVWLEEDLPGGGTRLASRPYAITVGRERPSQVDIRIDVRGSGRPALRGWVGIFPDRYVSRAEVVWP